MGLRKNPSCGRDLKKDMDYRAPVTIERINQGEPIICPTDNWWEDGVTFNPAAFYLERSPENDRVIRSILPMKRLDDVDLNDGVVAIHYRARPEKDPGSPFGRSFIGLSVFTPDLRLLYRYKEPVLTPSSNSDGFDILGVEDPRVHRFEGKFYMVYCGVQPDPERGWRANLCMAFSDDLLHWQKMGIMPGDLTLHNNKDGVLFPDVIDGKYYLLHRPFDDSWPHEDYSIHLAHSDSLYGPWNDLGEVFRAYRNPEMNSSWVGAGSVPIKVSENRYIEIYHTGNYLNAKDREYDLGASLVDFQLLDPKRPNSLVISRIEPLMRPETEAELRSKSQLQVGNVLFTCGSYLFREWLYIVYGGADTHTLAAKIRLAALKEVLENGGSDNPFS